MAAMRAGLPGGFEVASTAIVPDDAARITALISTLADSRAVDCILISGGTGLGARDVTPQATQAAIDYEVPGIPEAMRAAHVARIPSAMLSRAVAGVRKHTLVVDLPGSPAGARESLAVIAEVLPHALGLLRGDVGEHKPPLQS